MRLYHISKKYLGKSPVLVPRVPESASPGEKPVPRICVAPTVSGCYLACQYDWLFESMQYKRNVSRFHVYVTETDNHQKADKSVPDRGLTGERWLMEPHRFKHVGKMPAIVMWGCAQPWHGEAYRKRLFKWTVEGEFAWMAMRKDQGTD